MVFYKVQLSNYDCALYCFVCVFVDLRIYLTLRVRGRFVRARAFPFKCLLQTRIF